MTKEEAIQELRNILKPGDRVYTILRSVSRSGMSRCIDFYAIKGSKIIMLSNLVSYVTGDKFSRARRAERLRLRHGHGICGGLQRQSCDVP